MADSRKTKKGKNTSRAVTGTLGGVVYLGLLKYFSSENYIALSFLTPVVTVCTSYVGRLFQPIMTYFIDFTVEWAQDRRKCKLEKKLQNTIENAKTQKVQVEAQLMLDQLHLTTLRRDVDNFEKRIQ